MTTNKRWSELVQNTVKRVMPDGYYLNYIQCSQTTESTYFSILNENRLYYFRVSSHYRKKREDNVTTLLSGKYNGFKRLSEATGEHLKSNRFVRISDKHILILLLYLDNSFKLFWGDDTFYYIENGMDICSGINGTLKHYIKALLRYGVLYQEDLGNQIKINNSGKSLPTKYKKLLFPIYKGIDMEAVNSETLFNLVVDEKFANGFSKSKKIESINNLLPENVIKTYVDNNRSRLYSWFIPRRLRGKIKIGDQVKVINLNHTKIVTVTELYIAEKEEITKMEPVVKILDNKEWAGYMVAKKNTLKEASEKYQDTKRWELIPKDKKGIWREFAKEVSSDRSGDDFVGWYTAKGYNRRLRITVEYGTNESAIELKQGYLDTRREASEKYDDFKNRGLIPKKKKEIWREFLKEEDSNRNKGGFIGWYTVEGYTRNLGIKVEYGTGKSSWELRDRYLNTLLEKYKAELLELFDVNDFIEMAEKYGHEEGFMIDDIMIIDNFTDLLGLTRKARDLRETQMYLLRDKNRRNQRTESNEIEDYYDAFTHDLGAFVGEISSVMDKYRV